MPEQPGITLLLALTALVAWSVAAGERIRPAVLRRFAGWAGADRLQVAMVRAAMVQLVGLVLMSTWCMLAWLLGGLTGWTTLTRLMVLLAGVVLGPVWWAQGRVVPGAEPTGRVLARLGIPAEHAPTVAGIAGWGSLVGVLGLISIGAPSLWLEAGLDDR